MIRIPIASGRFYPGEPGPLRAMIKGMVDENAVKEDIIGLVSPHAGYLYSGPVAGAIISRVNLSDTVIIIGPNHTGQGKPLSIMTEGTWKTPLGEVEIDTRLGRKIMAASRYLKEDSRAHLHEHSIEVQLPFLQ
ncbi:MAG: AmmeMemoRadiSam system protein B, partial [Dehalococcoidales bacterium]|nr:AmmeMemoRadiSam system protein B [Dehalococcoidales bacterium]